MPQTIASFNSRAATKSGLGSGFISTALEAYLCKPGANERSDPSVSVRTNAMRRASAKHAANPKHSQQMQPRGSRTTRDFPMAQESAPLEAPRSTSGPDPESCFPHARGTRLRARCTRQGGLVPHVPDASRGHFSRNGGPRELGVRAELDVGLHNKYYAT